MYIPPYYFQNVKIEGQVQLTLWTQSYGGVVVTQGQLPCRLDDFASTYWIEWVASSEYNAQLPWPTVFRLFAIYLDMSVVTSLS